MSEERCECCELPVAWCGRAVEQRKRQEAANERRRLLALDGVVEAAYPGRCASPSCRDQFDKGEPIKMNAHGWGHAECP